MTASALPQCPLYGLVLAGGRSTRMHRDKAALEYRGVSELERAMALIERYVERAFVSVRRDQLTDPVRARFARIADTHEGLGPIAGLLAAQAEFPHAAWLVVACDLPLLDAATLDELERARRPERQATAFRSTHDGLPEPLCAIYEPASGAALAAYVASGRQCPRKFLLQADVELLEQPNPRALDNINTPEEYGAVIESLHGGPRLEAVGGAPGAARAARRVKVQYYALLREQAGRSEEMVETRARTPRELYEELRRRHPFSLAPEVLRVAVNAEFGEWSQALGEGDAVVFIPPVAGG
ncbi:MAG TPA: NTP transferase domain-containing protein [Steroidobacteraceae bacterium]|nr:NTP transferase domain-containing protein [Steroidobacteraceae bacterium]